MYSGVVRVGLVRRLSELDRSVHDCDRLLQSGGAALTCRVDWACRWGSTCCGSVEDWISSVGKAALADLPIYRLMSSDFADLFHPTKLPSIYKNTHCSQKHVYLASEHRRAGSCVRLLSRIKVIKNARIARLVRTRQAHTAGSLARRPALHINLRTLLLHRQHAPQPQPRQGGDPTM